MKSSSPSAKPAPTPFSILAWGVLLMLVVPAAIGTAQDQNDRALVRWEGQYVLTLPQPRLELGEARPIDSEFGEDTGVGFRPLPDEPMSPKERYDLTAPSAVFHGFLDAINPSAGAAGNLEQSVRHRCNVVSRSEDCFVRLGGEPPAIGETARVRGIIYWDHTGFIPGISDQKEVSPQLVDTMEVDVIGINSRLGQGAYRFAVRAGGDWFLSEDSFTRSGNALIPFDTAWAKWEIKDFESSLPEAPENFSISANDLPPIEAFGIFFDSVSAEQLDSDQGNAVFSFKKFEVVLNAK